MIQRRTDSPGHDRPRHLSLLRRTLRGGSSSGSLPPDPHAAADEAESDDVRLRRWATGHRDGRTLSADSDRFTGAHLIEAALDRTDLTGVHLDGADLTDATLVGADLTRADLTDATLHRADLTRADLTDATLDGADLTGTDLTGALLHRADLYGTDLTRALGLETRFLSGARWDTATRWAVGFGARVRSASEEVRPGVFEIRGDGSRDRTPDRPHDTGQQ